MLTAVNYEMMRLSDFVIIQQQLQSVGNTYFQARLQIHKINKGIKVTDVRSMAFTKCIHVIQATDFALGFLNEYLATDAWWLQKIPNIQEWEKSDLIYGYQQFLKVGYVNFIHSSVESSLRVYLKTLKPNACNNGTGEFKNIYESLLKETRLKKYRCLLDLLRLTRNTFHNNGIHTDKDQIITYKSETYRFEQGKLAMVFDWSHVINLTADLRELLLQLALSPKYPTISFIEDESATQIKEHPYFAERPLTFDLG